MARTGTGSITITDVRDGADAVRLVLLTEHQRHPTGTDYVPAAGYFRENDNYTGVFATYGEVTQNYEFGQRVIVEAANGAVPSVTRDGIWECSTDVGCSFSTFTQSEWTDTTLATTATAELQYRIRAELMQGSVNLVTSSTVTLSYTWYKDSIPRKTGAGIAFSTVEIDANSGGLYGGTFDNGHNVWEVRINTEAILVTSNTPALINESIFNTRLFN